LRARDRQANASVRAGLRQAITTVLDGFAQGSPARKRDVGLTIAR